MSNSSGEFPDKESFDAYVESPYYDSLEIWDRAARWGFERGRASLNGTLNAWEKLNETNERIQRKQQLSIRELEAKLEAERKYRQGLEHTILKLTEAFDKAKNAKVICEDCGSALWRA